MSGCDAVLRWGESRLIHTHRALRSGRIEHGNVGFGWIADLRHSPEERPGRAEGGQIATACNWTGLRFRRVTGVICRPLGSHRCSTDQLGSVPGIGSLAGGYFAVASARSSPFGPAEHSPHFGGASQIVLRSWFA